MAGEFREYAGVDAVDAIDFVIAVAIAAIADAGRQQQQ